MVQQWVLLQLVYVQVHLLTSQLRRNYTPHQQIPLQNCFQQLLLVLQYLRFDSPLMFELMLRVFFYVKVVHHRIQVLTIFPFIKHTIPIICDIDNEDLPFTYTILLN